jgi:hypothetical protein
VHLRAAAAGAPDGPEPTAPWGRVRCDTDIHRAQAASAKHAIGDFDPAVSSVAMYHRYPIRRYGYRQYSGSLKSFSFLLTENRGSCEVL